MDMDVENFVKVCPECQLVSAPSPPEPMIRTPLPEQPWHYIAIDFLGPLPSGHNLLCVVHYFSRYLEVEVILHMTANIVTEFLSTLFARFLLPLTVNSDNGSCFKDRKYKEFLEALNVERRHSIALWPQSNGEIEHQNRSLLKRMCTAQSEHRNWKEELQRYLFNYRATRHSVTGVAPAELMFRHSDRSKLPDVRTQCSNLSDEYIGIGILSRRKEGGFIVIRNNKP
jgi:hypothetical protein